MSIEEIDRQLAIIQRSTRTSLAFMSPLHNNLRMKYGWYYRWHLFRGADIAHFAILALSIFGSFVLVYNHLVPRTEAMKNASVMMHTKYDWELPGTTRTNIDSASADSFIKIDNKSLTLGPKINITSDMVTSSSEADAGAPINGNYCDTRKFYDYGSSWQVDLGHVGRYLIKVFEEITPNGGIVPYKDTSVDGVNWPDGGGITCPAGEPWCTNTYLAEPTCDTPHREYLADAPPLMRYFRFSCSDPAAKDGANSCVGLSEIEAYPIAASAVHISAPNQLDAGAHSNMKWTTFEPTYEVVPNTSLKFRFRTSDDQKSWSDWTAYAPAAASIGIESLLEALPGNSTNNYEKKRYLQVESTLENTDGASTPTLDKYIANYEYNALASMEVTPATVNVATGATQDFSAQAKDEETSAIIDAHFTWSTTCGSIDTNGKFTAPASVPAGDANPCTITAKTTVDGVTISDTAMATITATEVPEPTCSNGVQDTQNGETGVDCGGTCAACPTCTDGIQNGTETGIDCGGSCSATCDAVPACSKLTLIYPGMDSATPPASNSLLIKWRFEQVNRGRPGDTGASGITNINRHYPIKISVSTDSGVSYREVKTVTDNDYKVKNGNGTIGVDLPDKVRYPDTTFISYTWDTTAAGISFSSTKTRIKLEPVVTGCSANNGDSSTTDFSLSTYWCAAGLTK